jgi:ribonuclease T
MSDSIYAELHAYISVDVETAGPIPDRFALLSIGACTITHPRQTFYIELQPDRDLFDPQASAIHGLDPVVLARQGIPPFQAMTLFNDWVLQAVPDGNRPVFVAFNAPFDWMFINDYFLRYLGKNPFGHSALDIKALYMGAAGKPWSKTTSNELHHLYLDDRKLSHNALEDAIDQAIIFERIIASFAHP